MLIYPAIDLMAGRCVRLKEGRFDQSTTYSDDPAAALDQFARAGASWTHVVDLDGARAGAPVQHDLIARLAAAATQKLQVAGGFRTAEQVEAMLAQGAARVVIGSLAARAPDEATDLIRAFGADRITLAMDVRLVGDQPMVATAGWQQSSGRSLWDLASLFPEARHMLITDIARDGMMAGPNVALTAEAVRRLPGIEVQASGGVSSLADLEALATAGAHGAIVGKALWEACFTLEEAIDAGR